MVKDNVVQNIETEKTIETQEVIQPQTTKNLPIKKKKNWVIALSIFTILITYFYISYYVYSNYFSKNQDPKQTRLIEKNTNIKPLPFPTLIPTLIPPIPTPIIKTEEEYSEKYSIEIDKILNDLIQYLGISNKPDIIDGYGELNYHSYEGPFWIETSDKVYLLKGKRFAAGPQENTKYLCSDFKCGQLKGYKRSDLIKLANLIDKFFLEKNFFKSLENSENQRTYTIKAEPIVIYNSYRKGDIKCLTLIEQTIFNEDLIEGLRLKNFCGIFEEEFKSEYKYIPQNYYFNVTNVVNDYALLSIPEIILKKINGFWRFAMYASFRSELSCDELRKNKVPLSLFDFKGDLDCVETDGKTILPIKEVIN